MTIDEAIEIIKKSKDCQNEEGENCLIGDCETCEHNYDIGAYGEMLMQIPEWLEELKFLRTTKETMYREIYGKGRQDAIDECIKLIGGNIKSIVGIYNKDTPLTDRASYRVAKNELIEELVKQLEQLKESKA